MIIKATHALCTNRSQLSRLNASSGEPEGWFDQTYLNRVGLHTLAFDFFVDWTNPIVVNEIWLKRIIDPNTNPFPITNTHTISNWITQFESQNFLANLHSFCSTHNFNCHYFLFKDNVNWSTNPDEIVDFDLMASPPHAFITNPNDVQARIKSLRNSTSSIGPGGLIYGTSSLECYLSTKPDFWPGDVDLLLVDQNDQIKAVIEFKKHTKNTPIQQQTLMNYRNRDRLKYESLGLLRDKFTNQVPIPIIMIYYPTMPHITQVKIEKLDGPYNNLQVQRDWIVALPQLSNPNSFTQFTDFIYNHVL